MLQYRSAIKTDKVQIALAKTDEVKGLMKNNVIEMSSNLENVRDRLVPMSTEIVMEAQRFKKNAEELEKAAESRNFWAMSPKCLLIFGGGGGVAIALFYIVRAIIAH